FEPEGLFERVLHADAPAGDDAPLWARYHEQAIVESVRRHPGAFAATIAATYPLMRGREALTRGRLDEARAQVDAALAVAGEGGTSRGSGRGGPAAGISSRRRRCSSAPPPRSRRRSARGSTSRRRTG